MVIKSELKTSLLKYKDNTTTFFEEKNKNSSWINQNFSGSSKIHGNLVCLNLKQVD